MSTWFASGFSLKVYDQLNILKKENNLFAQFVIWLQLPEFSTLLSPSWKYQDIFKLHNIQDECIYRFLCS